MKTKTEAKETTKDEVNVKKKKRLTRESIEQTLDQPPGPNGEEVSKRILKRRTLRSKTNSEKQRYRGWDTDSTGSKNRLRMKFMRRSRRLRLNSIRKPPHTGDTESLNVCG